MNCIDCKWSIQLDEGKQCKKASPEIKECEGFEKAKRKIIKLEDNEDYKLKILCDKIDEMCKETNKLLEEDNEEGKRV